VPASKRPQVDDVQYSKVSNWILKGASYEDVMSHPVLKAKPNALITCAPGSSYTHT
jgi:hypothetical protein